MSDANVKECEAPAKIGELKVEECKAPAKIAQVNVEKCEASATIVEDDEENQLFTVVEQPIGVGIAQENANVLKLPAREARVQFGVMHLPNPVAVSKSVTAQGLCLIVLVRQNWWSPEQDRTSTLLHSVGPAAGLKSAVAALVKAKTNYLIVEESRVINEYINE